MRHENKSDLALRLLNRGAIERDLIALITAEERVTYRKLDARSNQLANALLTLDVRAGERLAFLLPNGPQILCCYLACAKTGIVGVPLSQRITGPELAFQIDDSGATAMLYGAEFAPLVAQVLDQIGGLRWILGEGAEIALDFVRLSTAAPVTPPRTSPRASDPFCAIYTGGTTGRPKASVQTHESWVRCLETTVEQWRLGRDDRHVIALPMSHAAWFTAGAVLQGGGTVTIAKSWNPDLVLDLVARDRITVLNMIPTMLGDLVTAYERRSRDVRSLRIVNVAGSVLPVALYRRACAAFGEVIGNIYGLTEAAGPVTFLLPADMQNGKFGSVGRPGKYFDLALLDDDGAPTSAEEGEIGLAGPQVTTGYLGQPEETRRAFAGRWFRTGDVGKIDADGFVSIVGRKKDMIKTGGFNVYPSEIEEALYRHPNVLEAAVIGVPDPKWSEAVHAIVVLRAKTQNATDELLTHCRGQLAGYKIPKAIHFADELPRTNFGKFDKLRLVREFTEAQSSK